LQAQSLPPRPFLLPLFFPATNSFSEMNLFELVLLFVAGLVSGAVNAVAGGGTFLTFGALSVVGIPPIAANATSSITQFPGYITSTLAYWTDIKMFWRGAVLMSVISMLGALAGALVLLALDNPAFRAMVPWLLIAATALFAAGPWLKPKPRPGKPATVGSVPGAIIQFVTAVYGGFFGAGMGVMMLATLGLTQSGDYHRLNALKNMLSIVIAAVAIAVFVSGGVVAWPQALVMIPAVAIGGYSGVWMARRVPQPVLRGFVIAVGLFLAVYYFATG
jgi:Predicted permeases